MMKLNRIDPAEFIRAVRPALTRRCAADLAEAVRHRWTPQQICQLLDLPSAELRKAACVTLGLVGDMSAHACLIQALKDEDPRVNVMAEYALWSIWCRAGSDPAMGHFKQGQEAMDRGDLPQALSCFHQASEVDPGFAEAFNQCGIVHFQMEDWHAALVDSQAAVQQLPDHFGALAGMGHCYAQLGELAEAVRCYRRALAVNPRLTAIADVLGSIEPIPG